jgi:hypothetical protein
MKSIQERAMNRAFASPRPAATAALALRLPFRACFILVFLSTILAAAAGCARSTVALDVGQEASAVVQGPGQPKVAGGEGFVLPTDKGGQALGQLLRPGERLAGQEDLAPGPRPLPVPVHVARAEVPLASTLAGPIRPPLPASGVVRPRMMPEGPPLTAYRDHPPPPSRRELQTGARVAVTGRDVNQPAPLGFLGLPLFDRAPLDDPTFDASLYSALAAVPPPRTAAVPFVPHNLPDPFQNAQTVRLRTPPAESPDPVAVTPKPPPPQAPPPKP